MQIYVEDVQPESYVFSSASSDFPMRWMGLVASHWASAGRSREVEGGGGGGARRPLCINEPVDQERPPLWRCHSSPIRPAEDETRLSPPCLFKGDVLARLSTLPQHPPGRGDVDRRAAAAAADRRVIHRGRWESTTSLKLMRLKVRGWRLLVFVFQTTVTVNTTVVTNPPSFVWSVWLIHFKRNCISA